MGKKKTYINKSSRMDLNTKTNTEYQVEKKTIKNAIKPS